MNTVNNTANLKIMDNELILNIDEILGPLEAFLRFIQPLLDGSTHETLTGMHAQLTRRDKDVDQVPFTDRLLLNFKEAAMLLSMSEASLRDLVHKGQGPENVRRGKRVCFTNEGLQRYVDGLPREYPYQGVIETIKAKGSRPTTIEEHRAFGV